MAAFDYVPIFFKYRLHLAGRPQVSTRPSFEAAARALRTKFPDLAVKFPDVRNIFPVNQLREMYDKACGTETSCLEIRPGAPKVQKFPAKFTVSRQFAWRLL